MKLLSFKINDKPSFGLLEDKCVIDLSDYFGSNGNGGNGGGNGGNGGNGNGNG